MTIRYWTGALEILALVVAIASLNFTSGDPTDRCSDREEYCVGKKRFADGSIYEGELKFGQPHGVGKLVWENGAWYQGRFETGVRTGLGEVHMDNGDVYTGSFLDGFMHGEGRYEWSNGTVYQGAFLQDAPHGKGTIRYSNGDAYEGDFFGGKGQGKGTFRYANGTTFKGTFYQNHRVGEGILQLDEHLSIHGTWNKNGDLNGQVRLYFDGKLMETAEWSKGKVNQTTSTGKHAAWWCFAQSMEFVKGRKIKDAREWANKAIANGLPNELVAIYMAPAEKQ